MKVDFTNYHKVMVGMTAFVGLKSPLYSPHLPDLRVYSLNIHNNFDPHMQQAIVSKDVTIELGSLNLQCQQIIKADIRDEIYVALFHKGDVVDFYNPDINSRVDDLKITNIIEPNHCGGDIRYAIDGFNQYFDEKFLISKKPSCYSSIGGPGETQNQECQHEWVETLGLSETYKDCKKCGIKWEDFVE